jgi:hypothetical protein
MPHLRIGTGKSGKTHIHITAPRLIRDIAFLDEAFIPFLDYASKQMELASVL